MNANIKLSCLFFWIFLSQALLAESYSVEEHDLCRKETYGETTLDIRSHYEKSMAMPDQNVTMYRKGMQAGRIDYFGDKLFVSPDNKYFLTVSNSGLCKIAYVLFDASGTIIRVSFQDTPLARLLLSALPANEYPVVYYENSLILHRAWYNGEQPEPRFLIDRGILQDVTINDPLNRRISLLEKYDFVKSIGEGTNTFTYGNVEIHNLNNFKIYEVHFSELVKTNSIKKGKYLFEFIEQEHSNDLIKLKLGVAFLGNKQDPAYGSEDESVILFLDKDRLLIDCSQCVNGSAFRGCLKFSRKGYNVKKLPEYIIWSVGPIDIQKQGASASPAK